MWLECECVTHIQTAHRDMYLNSIRRDWSTRLIRRRNPQIRFRVSFTQRFSWVHIFTTTVHSRLFLSIHYLYITSGGEFARAADRLKAIRRLAFPRGEEEGGKREQLPVFSGRLDLMIFFQRHSRDSAGRRTLSSLIRDAFREAYKMLLRVSAATFLRWKFYTESKRKNINLRWRLNSRAFRDVVLDIVIR